MTEQRETGSFFVLGAILGAAIGAVIGLLYAPRPGIETRRSLSDASGDWRKRASELGTEIGARSESVVHRIQESGAEDAHAVEADAEADTQAAWAEAPSESPDAGETV